MQPPDATRASHSPRWLVIAAVVLTAAAIGLALMRVPFGVHSEWVTEYAPARQWAAAWGGALVLALVVALCAWALKRKRPSRWCALGFVVALSALSFVAHVVVACAGEFGFAEFISAIVWDRAMGPYYKEAERVASASEYMATLDQRVQGGYQHSNTHPAGPGLIFYGVVRLVNERPDLAHAAIAAACKVSPSVERVFLPEKPEAERLKKAAALLLGLVLCLGAALAVVPTYWLAARLCGHLGGVLCAGLTSMLPSAMLFNPGVDQLMPVLSVALCATAYACAVQCTQPGESSVVARRRLLLGSVLLGTVMYAAFFFSLAFLVNIALCALCALAAAVMLGRDWRRLVQNAAMVAGVCACVVVFWSALFWVWCRYDTLRVLWAVLEQNAAFNVHSERTYWKWLLANPVQFFVFSGCPVATLLCFGMVADLRRIVSRTEQSVPYALCFVAVMALLWLSGKNLGEVERLWVFVMPLAAIAGAASLKATGATARATALWLLGAQALQVVIFRACFDVYGAAGYFRQLLG